MTPISRVLIIALISGLVSGILTTVLFWFVYPTPWFFLIVPAVMGWSIKHYAHITMAETEVYENLDSNVGWICAGITLGFVLLTALLVSVATYMVYGSFWAVIMNFGFFIACGLAVWYGHNRGVQAVVDSGYDDFNNSQK